MDDARYYIALFIVVFAPGIFVFWFSIHPFIDFWRKIGAKRTLTIHFVSIFVLAIIVFIYREWMLSVEYGAHPVLIVLAALCFVVTFWIRMEQTKKLSNKVLIGFPELAPQKYESKLITDGIYASIRHPRYVQILFAYLAYALFSNYLASYIVFLLSVVWVLILVRIEEKELLNRFGQEYEQYSKRVPRFIPRRSDKFTSP